MSWFKVDDNLAFHAKTVAAGNAAMGLWVRAGSWCCQQGVDGVLPEHMLQALGTTTQAQRLVEVGLWHTFPGGYEFHDWLHFQPSASEVRADRAFKSEQKQKAGRLGGIASGVARRRGGEAGAKQNGSSGEAEGKQNEAPSLPDPTLPVLDSVEREVEVALADGVEAEAVERIVVQLAQRQGRAS